MITLKDFENAIDMGNSLYPVVNKLEVAERCFELAKQMAIGFQVYNGMLPEVAKYHFEEWQKVNPPTK